MKQMGTTDMMEQMNQPVTTNNETNREKLREKIRQKENKKKG